MKVQRDPTSGKVKRNPETGKLIRWGEMVRCCCDDGGEDPPPPEDPGTDPDRDFDDFSGSGGCACFRQYTAILVTVAGIVNCSPQIRRYACTPGGSVDAFVTLTGIPQGSWSVPVTYDPSDSQVGYTNKNVILMTLPDAIEIRSADGSLYSKGGLRLRLVRGKVRACNDKRLEAVVNLETTDVVVQNRDAFNDQRADFGVNCADPNGAPDGRFNSAALGEFQADCTVACAAPLTCTVTRSPGTCPDAPNTVDGQLTAGGSATFTAV